MFEILEQLGRAPDVVALPFGGGGNVSAVALGLAEAGESPRIVVGQAAERATTWASAIRIGDPAHAVNVAALVDAGRVEAVTLAEEELRTAWQRLSNDEGVFCEPASAAGLAALEHISGLHGATVVVIVTGHGLKDAEAVDGGGAEPVEATLDAVLAAIG